MYHACCNIPPNRYALVLVSSTGPVTTFCGSGYCGVTDLVCEGWEMV